MFNIGYLTSGYEYFVFPSVLRDVELPMSKFQKEDGSYYSISQLEAEYPSVEAVGIIDDRFLVLNFAFANTGKVDERALIKGYLEGNGFVDMCAGKDVEEIDFTTLNGNEFGLFNALEIRSVPTASVETGL